MGLLFLHRDYENFLDGVVETLYSDGTWIDGYDSNRVASDWIQGMCLIGQSRLNVDKASQLYSVSLTVE